MSIDVTPKTNSLQNESKRELYERLSKLERKLEHQKSLPHLYGFPWYKWAWEFFKSTNRMNILVAANQISKSSTQIRKCIEWATNKELWESLFANRTPRQFWYLYPNKDVATAEFHTKWKPEFLPRVEEDHEIYGWKAEFENKKLKAIWFKSGVVIYFKTYETDISALQSGSCDAIFCFTKGNKILTKNGLVDISKIQIGDYVLTKGNTFERVSRVGSRESDDLYIIKVDKYTIRVTGEHPFMTHKGWVPVKDLQSGTCIVQMPEWILLEKIYYLKEKYTHVLWIIKTIEKEIILDVLQIVPCTMWSYGKHIIKKISLTIVVYTMWILTLLIIQFQTWKCLLEKSIQKFIKLPNGKKKDFILANVFNVYRNFSQEGLKNLFLDIVPKHVEKKHISGKVFVLFAKKSLQYVKTALKYTAIKYVQIEQIQKQENKDIVYNITVDKDPTYFCQSFLVHNCDEELPETIFPELRARLMATQGYFHTVFTATLGQEFWFDAIECIGLPQERFPTAFKRQVSMYDCLNYMDGNPSPWSIERIQLEESFCKNEAEKLRRIYGKFIRSENIAVPLFTQSSHHTYNPFGPAGTIPNGWVLYSAVDIGSSQGAGHPAAVIFLAVNPQRTKARVVRCWRGDKTPTTCGDILEKYLAIEGEVTLIAPLAARVYDQASSEFFLISQSKNIFFDKSDKDRKSGFLLLNTLFRYDVLEIDKDIEDGDKLVAELRNVADDSPEHILDDLLSCLRYVCKKIPFDFDKIMNMRQPASAVKSPVFLPIITPEQIREKREKERLEREMRDRRGDFEEGEGRELDPMDEEMDYWNDPMSNDL